MTADMAGTTLAATERAALADELARTGPDKPTLCEGWSTRDLLAHMLVRERQPWASGGILVPFLAPVTEHAMRGYADTPWTEMVGLLRDGAPPWSPFRIAALDAQGNAAEYFVHHEDVRRGEPGWEPRPADPVREKQVWALLARTGRMLYRRSPVGVVLRRPSGEELVVRTGPNPVTLVGTPDELLLHAFGRSAVRVEVRGGAEDVEKFTASARGV